ncbi:NADH dehydrogenase [ubiquinone] 1 alpha subcomplex subunit 10, mitochondrial [Culicoides brevitarsis]|uniref:NADH dehydrogenase [ubiquinone] 1 alpha subcomplex subunit 10, mitochondrial n=1 Tax=Culicoides brevitarsis TaxID=469753 RepID=UPI00307C0618
MAAVFRAGVKQLIAPNGKCLLSVQLPAISQSCNITGKSFRGKTADRPKPWDYKNKGYNVIHSIFDKTRWRWDENSKIIVVDGPIASGKTDFAKSLADELEMMFMPEPHMDRVYVNSYGFDLRTLNDKLPPACRSIENKDFLMHPENMYIANYQFYMMVMRFHDYIDALAHVFNTGQGVVLERSIYSDFVFMETMFKHGYLSKNVRSYYHQIMYHILPELMKPHLAIYLDVPVAEVKNRIKKRNIDYEVNSKVLTDEYLTTLESIYKQQYLKDISKHAELLVYDWSNYGDAEVVVEDIERIDFDRFEKHDPKLRDWRLGHEEEYNAKRMWYTNEKPTLMRYLNIPRLDVPELMLTADENDIYNTVVAESPGNRYDEGYNEDAGDTGLLTKTKTPWIVRE